MWEKVEIIHLISSKICQVCKIWVTEYQTEMIAPPFDKMNIIQNLLFFI